MIDINVLIKQCKKGFTCGTSLWVSKCGLLDCPLLVSYHGGSMKKKKETLATMYPRTAAMIAEQENICSDKSS